MLPKFIRNWKQDVETQEWCYCRLCDFKTEGLKFESPEKVGNMSISMQNEDLEL